MSLILIAFAAAMLAAAGVRAILGTSPVAPDGQAVGESDISELERSGFR